MLRVRPAGCGCRRRTRRFWNVCSRTTPRSFPRRHPPLWREAGALVRAVAKRLAFGFPAGTPVVAAGFYFQDVGGFLGNDRFAHASFVAAPAILANLIISIHPAPRVPASRFASNHGGSPSGWPDSDAEFVRRECSCRPPPARRVRVANAPMPMSHSGWRISSTRCKCSSQTAPSCARSALESLSGVTLLPLADRNASGQ